MRGGGWEDFFFIIMMMQVASVFFGSWVTLLEYIFQSPLRWLAVELELEWSWSGVKCESL